MNNFPKIYAWNKSSEAGPDNFAPSIFLGGCNFRCPYCMNAKLVLLDPALKEYDLDTIKMFVHENHCAWINISGGEPTMHDTLDNLLQEIKGWGCKIAMSTNGTYCEKLKSALRFVDYITMDFKTTPKKYCSLVNFPRAINGFKEWLLSAQLLREKKKTIPEFDYEFRTTLYRPFVDLNDMIQMGAYVLKQEKWVLQPFRQASSMLGEEAYTVTPYNDRELEVFKTIAERYSDNVKLRYV